MTQQLRKTIFLACRQLGLNDETRRDLQLVATGKAVIARGAYLRDGAEAV